MLGQLVVLVWLVVATALAQVIGWGMEWLRRGPHGVWVTRGLTEQRSGGVGWGTLVTIAVLTLLVGAFLGNLVASRRRSAPRLSVYGAIQRQLDAERSAGPKR